MKQSDVIREIKRNYQRMEQKLLSELFMTVNAHHLTTGTFREKIWKDFFKNIIPKKFTIEQGAFLIDSEGNVSRETDLIIFDEQYTPYVLKHRNIQFIPIEAVVAAIQCKSTQLKKRELLDWEKSIDALKPNRSGYAGSAHNTIILNDIRMIRPLKLVCGLFDMEEETTKDFVNSKSQSDLFIVAHSKKGSSRFYQSRDNRITIYTKHETVESVFNHVAEKTLTEYDENEKNETLRLTEDQKRQIEEIRRFPSEQFSIKANQNGEKISLLTLVFQLNQYLMLINNPMLFPHRAYIEMFNRQEHDLNNKDPNYG